MSASKARAIFVELVAQVPPEQWQERLAVLAGEDAALRDKVALLLAAHRKADSFLEHPAAPLGETADDAGATPAPLDRAAAGGELAETAGAVLAGRFKLLEAIGKGGMGTVWMAQQTEPIKRLVAVKLINPGMDSKQVLARFEAERQALALMDHPNIAKVHDAGTTPDGRPFFVMELVKGVPFTRYCDEQRLTPRERLELFVPVCQAVQHAHTKGVIHRDLKPSNVLVALYDGKPVPKVIDFGIAKATGQQLTDKTLVTGYGAVVGTLEYMSPEQAELNQLDIDTRSDIYSLGVLLYELLTGTTPLERKRLKAGSLLEALRLIREEEPPRPSTRLGTTEELPSIAANRGLEPKKLSGLVKGELDWVVMKALDKERNRRYESASAFAADVQCYLHDEPVQAGPPSATYRLRKFVRRHRGPVLAVGVIVLLLTAGIAGTTIGLIRALAAGQQALAERDQKDEARLRAVAATRVEALSRRQTRQALNTMTDEVVEELLGKQVQLTDRHREFLKKVLAYHAEFAAAKADDPEGRHSRAEGYYRVALIRDQLGEIKDAESAYREAFALLKRLAAQFPSRTDFREDLSLTCNNLGILLRKSGRPKEAERAYRDALALQKQLAADFPNRPNLRRGVALSQSNLGNVLSDMGRLAEAQTAYRDALDRMKRLAADFPNRPDFRQRLASSHFLLGTILSETGRPKEAESAYREALALQKPLAAKFPNQPDFRDELALTHNNLGNLLRATGRPEEAEAAYRDALTLWKHLAAEFLSRPDLRQKLALAHRKLGTLLLATGRPKEAEAALRKALALQQQLATGFPGRPDFRQELARSHHSLGSLLSAIGRPKEAEAAYRDALALQKRLAAGFTNRPDFRNDLALTHNNLGDLLHATGRLPEAAAAWHDALALWKQLAADFPNRTDFRMHLARSHNNRGSLLRKTGRLKEAEAALRKALDLWKQLPNVFPDRTDFRQELARSHNSLGMVLRDTGRPEEAESAYRNALDLRKRLAADFPNRTDFRQELAVSHSNLGSLLRATNRPREAEAAQREALALRKKLAAAFPDRTDFRQELAVSHEILGNLLRDTGRPAEAEAAYHDALALLKPLAADFPNRPDFRNGLAGCSNNLGVLLGARNRPKEAEAAYRDALTLFKQLAADFPTVPDYQFALATTLSNLAILDLQRGEFADALSLLEQARPYHQAALGASPKNPKYRRSYRNHLLVVAESRAGLADHARLATTADELARFGYDPANDTYHAACFLCRCATLADKDAQLDEAKRTVLVQKYSVRALALLGQAVAHGFKNVPRMKQDPNLEPLRARQEFRKLLADLDRKTKE